MINNEYNNDEVYPLGKGLNVKPENINFSYKIKSKKVINYQVGLLFQFLMMGKNLYKI